MPHRIIPFQWNKWDAFQSNEMKYERPTTPPEVSTARLEWRIIRSTPGLGNLIIQPTVQSVGNGAGKKQSRSRTNSSPINGATHIRNGQYSIHDSTNTLSRDKASSEGEGIHVEGLWRMTFPKMIDGGTSSHGNRDVHLWEYETNPNRVPVRLVKMERTT